MVVSVVGVSSTATWAPTAGTPFSPPLPAGVATGDAFLVPVLARTPSVTINALSTYTLLTPDNQTDATQLTAEASAKITGASEASPSVDSSIADTQPTAAVVIALRGADAVSNWVVPTPNLGASNIVPAPDGVATANGSSVVRVYFQGDDNTVTTAPAGYTQIFFENSIQGSDGCLAVFVSNSTINSGVSAGVASCVFSGSDPYWAATFIIPPGGVSTTPVSSDLDLRWRVATRVNSDLDVRWRAATRVTSDLDARWRVYSRLTSDVDLRWRTATRVTSDIDLRWRTAVRINSDLDLRWRQWSSATSDLDLRWVSGSSLVQVTSDLDLRWLVRNQVTSLADLRWRVAGQVTSDADLRWLVYGKVSSDLTLGWRVLGQAPDVALPVDVFVALAPQRGAASMDALRVSASLD